jgi:hypothetical protein
MLAALVDLDLEGLLGTDATSQLVLASGWR